MGLDVIYTRASTLFRPERTLLRGSWMGCHFTSGRHKAGLPRGPPGEQAVTDSSPGLCQEPVLTVFFAGQHQPPYCYPRHCSMQESKAFLLPALLLPIACSAADSSARAPDCSSLLLLFIITHSLLCPVASFPSLSFPIISPSSSSSSKPSVPSFLEPLNSVLLITLLDRYCYHLQC